MNILLTGGVGYIGSHAAVVLAEAGHKVILYDNLCNSDAKVVKRLNEIVGKDFIFYQGDTRDSELLEQVLRKHKIEAVIHFAGLKAVGESVSSPLEYYSNNVVGTINLLQAMTAVGIKNLVFSSSATVYGDPQYLPIDENHPIKAVNPYGRTKVQIEEILTDVAKSDDNWRIVLLRYFNPAGAHDSGLIGENPTGVPNNLMAYIANVAVGNLPHLNIFGDDYQTPDGTGIRDYIHVVDLAEGHLAALDYLVSSQALPLSIFNLGTGEGFSVLDMVNTFEVASGCRVPYQVTSRRPGDVAICYAKVDKAINELNWKTKRDLKDMCVSAWKFQSRL